MHAGTSPNSPRDPAQDTGELDGQTGTRVKLRICILLFRVCFFDLVSCFCRSGHFSNFQLFVFIAASLTLATAATSPQAEVNAKM